MGFLTFILLLFFLFVLVLALKYAMLEMCGTSVEAIVASKVESRRQLRTGGGNTMNAVIGIIKAIFGLNNNLVNYRFMTPQNEKIFGKSRVSGSIFYSTKLEEPVRVKYWAKYPSVNQMQDAIALRFNELVMLIAALVALLTVSFVLQHFLCLGCALVGQL